MEQAPVAMTVYGPSNPCSERRMVPMLPLPTFSAAIHGGMFVCTLRHAANKKISLNATSGQDH